MGTRADAGAGAAWQAVNLVDCGFLTFAQPLHHHAQTVTCTETPGLCARPRVFCLLDRVRCLKQYPALAQCYLLRSDFAWFALPVPLLLPFPRPFPRPFRWTARTCTSPRGFPRTPTTPATSWTRTSAAHQWYGGCSACPLLQWRVLLSALVPFSRPLSPWLHRLHMPARHRMLLPLSSVMACCCRRCRCCSGEVVCCRCRMSMLLPL